MNDVSGTIAVDGMLSAMMDDGVSLTIVLTPADGAITVTASYLCEGSGAAFCQVARAGTMRLAVCAIYDCWLAFWAAHC